MNADTAIDIIRNAFLVSLQVAGPALVATLAVGLVVGVFQASTQVNEPSVTFLAKLIGVGVVLGIAGPKMLTTMIEYTRASIGSISTLIR